MPDHKRILLVLDHLDASKRAVSYVANILRHRTDMVVRLFHVSPHLPPVLAEPRGNGCSGNELAWFDDGRRRYEEECGKEAQQVFDEAMSVLSRASVPSTAVESQSYQAIGTRDVVDSVLDVARKDDFGTVVVGRRSLCWLSDRFRCYFSDELARRAYGITVWIVQ
jgi:hypothetical protein